MSLDSAVRIFAGLMVMISLALTVWVNPLFIWLTAFVGFNLIQSAFTGFCPAAMVFKKFGLQ
ncbi:DUF2892 domain-containing protein [Grimontia sp. S25]|uniref:DUF2892 domain-containing protein n=1 Tax=Grimontia sedimenti TaxID=2711294 RepID=A0A6M1RLD3_9GAMM|nr:DUF2892 domain-containing protein [Grimontia sedimenti]NGN98971.1 DUF2892 domain-containing protein [Grimontia sedimenti]